MHKHGQAFLKSEDGNSSMIAFASFRSRDIFAVPWKRAVLLGAGCLLGLMYAANLTLKPNRAQTDNVTTLQEEARIRSHTSSESYYWPSAHGPVGSYTKSPFPANVDIANPTWTWNYDCCFSCTWCTIPTGVNIDDKKNIYLTAQDGIRKFTSHGTLLWHYRPRSGDVMKKVAALMDGVAYALSLDAVLYAVSMDTGKKLWSKRVAEGCDMNDGQTIAHLGVILVAAGATQVPNKGTGSKHVYALNGTDGSKVWSFTPDAPLWNFGASCDNEGAVTYMDLSGKLYRHFVKNGTLLWKAGGITNSWTDGQANLGSNGIVYGVANYFDTRDADAHFQKGRLSAHRLSDGKMLWIRNVSRPPNSVPAVGMLVGQSKLSVVMPVGHQCKAGEDIGVYAFDAETGEEQWWFHGPTQAGIGAPDDTNPAAIAQRTYNGVTFITAPNPWGIPTIDGDGKVFVGGITGQIYRLQDSDGDGKVAGPQEAAHLTTDAGTCGGSGPAIAPGLLAVANSHSLFVWNF